MAAHGGEYGAPFSTRRACEAYTADAGAPANASKPSASSTKSKDLGKG